MKVRVSMEFILDGVDSLAQAQNQLENMTMQFEIPTLDVSGMDIFTEVSEPDDDTLPSEVGEFDTIWERDHHE